jgi:hypothetical protein
MRNLHYAAWRPTQGRIALRAHHFFRRILFFGVIISVVIVLLAGYIIRSPFGIEFSSQSNTKIFHGLIISHYEIAIGQIDVARRQVVSLVQDQLTSEMAFPVLTKDIADYDRSNIKHDDQLNKYYRKLDMYELQKSAIRNCGSQVSVIRYDVSVIGRLSGMMAFATTLFFCLERPHQGSKSASPIDVGKYRATRQLIK